ncbi:hypothetical protein LXA43DRAFT_1095485 [Ganoderma leucocontextum]|nr:hypothetical protein LXA43DRAFT_1095485 [Ganoderma leucocontextum]
MLIVGEESDEEEDYAMLIVGECDNDNAQSDPDSFLPSPTAMLIVGEESEEEEDYSTLLISECDDDNPPLAFSGSEPDSESDMESVQTESGMPAASDDEDAEVQGAFTAMFIVGEAEDDDLPPVLWPSEPGTEESCPSEPGSESDTNSDNSSPRDAILIVGEADDDDASPPGSWASESDGEPNESDSETTQSSSSGTPSADEDAKDPNKHIRNPSDPLGTSDMTYPDFSSIPQMIPVCLNSSG